MLARRRLRTPARRLWVRLCPLQLMLTAWLLRTPARRLWVQLWLWLRRLLEKWLLRSPVTRLWALLWSLQLLRAAWLLQPHRGGTGV